MSDLRFTGWVLSCFLGACLCSCDFVKSSSNETIQGEVKVIVAPEISEGEVHFQEFVEDVKIIPLETNGESMFRTVSDFVFMNGKFYVFDMMMQELFVFDENGTFLYKLNKRCNR